MEEGAESSGQIVLLLVLFEEEIAYRMLVGCSELMVNERFSKDGLATARIRRKPEKAILIAPGPLQILRVR